MDVSELAQAHLVTVQNTIAELQQKQKNLEAEVEKLQSYLQEGLQTLKDSNNSTGE